MIEVAKKLRIKTRNKISLGSGVEEAAEEEGEREEGEEASSFLELIEKFLT